MSSLKPLEKEQLEMLLGMGGGYVLEFSDRTFAKFFGETVNVDIDAGKYQRNGTSKAKRLRAFWELEGDNLVGKVIAELLDYWAFYNPEPSTADLKIADQVRKVADRLLGVATSPQGAEEVFLHEDLSSLSLANATGDKSLIPILERRFVEAQRCLQADAPLAAIFLCGSVLEGLLLGTACQNPQEFNQADNSPKDNAGKVKQLPAWKLAELIDVACEAGFLRLDVKKFSHSLRDFRNYIHPYQQLSSGFEPDRHTAQICLQVLRAAIASLSR
jgi:hypothetical protein